jgi:hypothetical protein
MGNGQVPGALPMISFSRGQRIPGSDCGVVRPPFGEVLISPSQVFGTVAFPAWDGTNASLLDLGIPNNLALVNATLFVQGAFLEPTPTPAEDFRLSNALRIEIGFP